MAPPGARRPGTGLRGLAAAATAFAAVRAIWQLCPTSAFATREPCSVAVRALAGTRAAATVRRARARIARCAGGTAPPAYTLHVYDHCPFCNRVEILLGRFGIPYDRVVYGYGEGAKPDSCGGTGYNPEGGPVALIGKKACPVLQGQDVPTAAGAQGMPESLEICSYVIGKHGLTVPCDSGRSDLAAFRKELKGISGLLIKPREAKMPVKDWADPRDAEYARWKYTKKGFNYEDAEAATPELVAKVNEKLKELVPLIRGTDSLNSWGFGMDDLILLPDLRKLRMVRGVVFPKEVAAYMDASLEKTKLCDYSKSAV